MDTPLLAGYGCFIVTEDCKVAIVCHERGMSHFERLQTGKDESRKGNEL